MTRFFLICLGGAVGTGARYLLSLWMARSSGSAFPFGTLAVNVLGSFLLVVLMHVSLSTGWIGSDARLILGAGVLGGFTTYSTFNYETLMLMRGGSWSLAAANVAATFFGCLAAGALAIVIVRA